MFRDRISFRTTSSSYVLPRVFAPLICYELEARSARNVPAALKAEAFKMEPSADAHTAKDPIGKPHQAYEEAAFKGLMSRQTSKALRFMKGKVLAHGLAAAVKIKEQESSESDSGDLKGDAKPSEHAKQLERPSASASASMMKRPSGAFMAVMDLDKSCANASPQNYFTSKYYANVRKQALAFGLSDDEAKEQVRAAFAAEASSVRKQIFY